MQSDYHAVDQDQDGLHIKDRIPLASKRTSINVVNIHHGEISFFPC